MADKSMTIEGVKKAKVQLELDILKLVKDFEAKTKVKTGYINIQRESDAFYDQPVEATRSKKRKKRTIKNVEVNMDIDLM